MVMRKIWEFVILENTFKLKGKKVLDITPSIAFSKSATIPVPPPQERKHHNCSQCADFLISFVGASTAASWKPHIHKANKASFFNDSSEYIFLQQLP